MDAMSRRVFLLWSGAAVAGLSGLSHWSHAAAPRRVVIIGGGFGGATCAKYLKRFAPELDVSLIDAARQYVTCPFSNTVIAGLNSLQYITHSYSNLQKRYGIKLVHDWVTDVDTERKRIKTASAIELQYDDLIVSPGIAFRWDAIEGYNAAMSERMPHAWRAGPQTQLLRRQLEAMPDGGVVIIAAPSNPFRCPPGPYERASLIAHYLSRHKPKSKVLILDAKMKFSKQPLFQDAWSQLYGEMIEWIPANEGGSVTSVDYRTMSVLSDQGDRYQGAVVNIIPPQKAGFIAQRAGLVDDSGWCPVNQKTFESRLRPDVYVLGDASIAGKMPKSAYAANSQAKACAAQLVAKFKSVELLTSSWVNTCYSLVAPDYGISVAAVYRLSDSGIVSIKGAGGVSQRDAGMMVRNMEALYAKGWYQSITADSYT